MVNLAGDFVRKLCNELDRHFSTGDMGGKRNYELWNNLSYEGKEIMNFGEAVEEAKNGSKIAREGWDGKGMFVVYMEPLYLPPFNTQGTSRKVNDRTAKWIGEDTPLDCCPYFAMFTADKKWQPGWLASQADMLAEDWEIVE